MVELEKRGFLPVNINHRWINLGGDGIFYIPQRATKYSAGYDFASTESYKIKPGQIIKIFTNIKAYMHEDEYLDINIRSSIAMKKDLRLVNCVGIIDSDFYSNPKNDGLIIIGLINEGDVVQYIDKGERVAQGIFKKYLIIDDDIPKNSFRTGGLGSTGK